MISTSLSLLQILISFSFDFLDVFFFSNLIPHVCVHAISSNQDARVRILAVRCLRLLCDFDGSDITGAIFLSHMDKKTISLVGRVLQQLSVVDLSFL